MLLKEYSIKDVCRRLSSGKSIPSKNVLSKGNFPVVGGNGIRGYSKDSNFNGECVAIGRQGAYCGNVHYYNGEYYMTEHAIVAVCNQLADTYYLYCVLSLMDLNNLSSQSAQPGLSVNTLAHQKIKLPPLEYQKKVSAVLKSLDKKITLNRQINDNLPTLDHSSEAVEARRAA